MNHRHPLTVWKLSLATVLMAALGASQVYAQDSKVYPGLMCVDLAGNTGSSVYNYGTIGNDSTTNTLVIGCPIIRDGLSMYNGWVQVLDRHGTQDVACRVVTAYRSGNVHVGSGSAWQRSASVGGAQLAFGGISPSNLAHFYYSCTVPSKTPDGVSLVVSYKVTENAW